MFLAEVQRIRSHLSFSQAEEGEGVREGDRERAAVAVIAIDGCAQADRQDVFLLGDLVWFLQRQVQCPDVDNGADGPRTRPSWSKPALVFEDVWYNCDSSVPLTEESDLRWVAGVMVGASPTLS